MDNKDDGKVYIRTSDTASVSAARGSTGAIGGKSKTYKTQKPRKHLGAQKAQKKQGAPKKAVVSINEAGDILERFESAPDAEDYYNLPSGSVGRVCRGTHMFTSGAMGFRVRRSGQGFALGILQFRFA